MVNFVNHSTVKCPSKRADSRVNKFPFEFDQIWVDKQIENHPQTLRILNNLKSVETDIIEDVSLIKHTKNIDKGKRRILLTAHKGRAFKVCQGVSQESLCCNYRVLDLISGCPMDCSYCILQSYLANNPTTIIYVNVEDALAQVSELLDSHLDKFYRIGTGELSDSLALDPITEFSSQLIPFFAAKENALLELKTKTANIDHILPLKHKGHTVLAWSVNTENIITHEEKGTATLEERLSAAKSAVDNGYKVAFHFDPIILTRENTIDGYLQTVDKIFEFIEPRHISWVSLGMLRYPLGLSEITYKRFPDTKIFSGELLPSSGKVRYLRFIRQDTYRTLWERLLTKLKPNKLYLCMETEAVWEKIDPIVKTSACIENRVCCKL